MGGVLIDALVWTVAIELSGVLGQDRAGVPLAVDLHVVRALLADATRKPVRVTVRPRHPAGDYLHHHKHIDAPQSARIEVEEARSQQG